MRDYGNISELKAEKLVNTLDKMIKDYKSSVITNTFFDVHTLYYELLKDGVVVELADLKKAARTKGFKHLGAMLPGMRYGAVDHQLFYDPRIYSGYMDKLKKKWMILHTIKEIEDTI